MIEWIQKPMIQKPSTPFPMARMVQKVNEAKDPIARFIQLGNLSEVTLRYCATLVLGSYFSQQNREQLAIPPKVLSGLNRPSLGHWCQVLHALPKRLEEAGVIPIPELTNLREKVDQPEGLVNGFRELQFFLGKKPESASPRFSISAFFDLLVAFRNRTKAHGAIQNRLAQGLNPILETSLAALLDALSFLDTYPPGLSSGDQNSLQHSLSDPKCPGEGNLGIFDRRGNCLIKLFPAAIWTQGDFWFLNGWQDTEQFEFLSYASGSTRQQPIPGFFADLKPVLPAPGEGIGPNVILEISRREVWDFSVDVAILGQDRHRVFGPVQDIDLPETPHQEIRQAIAELSGQEPEEILGDVLISTRSWSSARYLLEAIIFDFDRNPITELEIVETALGNALVLAGDLAAGSLAVRPLGNEYQIISAEQFAETFFRLWEKHRKTLGTITRIIFTPREEEQVIPLQAALSGRCGRPIAIIS